MKLITQSTGSKGNSYALVANNESLIIEAGVPYSKVLPAIDYNVADCEGFIVSHLHGDHAKYVESYQKNGLKFLNPGSGQYSKYGNFQILSFPLVHDVENDGFVITHSRKLSGFENDLKRYEGTCVVYITDTMHITKTFASLPPFTLIVEANYSMQDMSEDVPDFVKHRTANNHLSLETLKAYIRNYGSKNINNIVLIHLSDSNSHEIEFQKQIAAMTGVPVYVAAKGKEIYLNV